MWYRFVAPVPGSLAMWEPSRRIAVRRIAVRAAHGHSSLCVCVCGAVRDFTAGGWRLLLVGRAWPTTVVLSTGSGRR